MNTESMKNEHEGSHMNHGALIEGQGVQIGADFTHCHGQFTLCYTWQNVLIHTETLMSVNEAIRTPSFISMVASRGLRANHHWINFQATEIKEKMERWKILKYFMEVCYSWGRRF